LAYSYIEKNRGSGARVVIFNPFEHVNKKDVKKRVARLKKKNPHLSNEEICRILIRKKSRWCTAAGVVTTMPGTVPVLGTLFVIVGGTALDLTAMAFLLTELILEVAEVYNRNLDLDMTSREVVWVLISSIGSSAAGRGLSSLTVAQLSGSTFLRLVEHALLALGIRTSQKTVLRVIPVIGMVVAGWVNYYTCNKVGSFVIKHYSENANPDSWEGKTIDVEASVE
jgi:hypothetical protein